MKGIKVMKKIPSKYLQMVFMGAFMCGGIAFTKRTADMSILEAIAISLIIALGGAIIGAVLALLVWAGERLKAYRAASHGRTHLP